MKVDTFWLPAATADVRVAGDDWSTLQQFSCTISFWPLQKSWKLLWDFAHYLNNLSRCSHNFGNSFSALTDSTALKQITLLCHTLLLTMVLWRNQHRLDWPDWFVSQNLKKDNNSHWVRNLSKTAEDYHLPYSSNVTIVDLSVTLAYEFSSVF